MIFELRRCLRGLARGVVLCGLKVVQLGLSVLVVLSYCLLGVRVLNPYLACTRLARRWIDVSRRLAGEWSDVFIASPYRPAPAPPRSDAEGRYRTGRLMLRNRRWARQRQLLNALSEDQATWRDLLWMASDPLIGTVLAALPTAAVCFGVFWLAVPWLWNSGDGLLNAVLGPVPGEVPAWVTVAVGLVLVVLGIGLAPAMVDLHARWTRVLLAPVEGRGVIKSAQRKRWARRQVLALVRTVALYGLALVHGVLGLVTLVGLVLTGVGGAVFVPAGRALANLRRLLAREWTGVEIMNPYLPAPPPPQPRPDGMYQYGRRLYHSPQIPAWRANAKNVFFDPATWRDLAYQILDPLAGLVLLVPLAVITFGVGDFATQGRLTRHLLTAAPGWASSLWLTFPLGYALAAAAFVAVPAVLRLHSRWARFLLAPTASVQWTDRVRQLTETRADATYTKTAELQRIERDLHDGAQARLIAVGMMLGTVEALIERDPAEARRLVAKARDTSSVALSELRQLVRGICPPVLTERGLPDALRALALDCPLPVHVSVDLEETFELPVESAVYFVLSELLTNTVKHAHADEIWLEVHYENGRLRAKVVDDGRGGADPRQGGGLRGIERRLGTFDGLLTVTSPTGGPTVAILEIPCAPPN